MSTAMLRIGLTRPQAATSANCLVQHIREGLVADVVVDGVKYDLAELLRERLGASGVELMLVNTTMVEERQNAHRDSHDVPA